jgi:hypothetical protein
MSLSPQPIPTPHPKSRNSGTAVDSGFSELGAVLSRKEATTEAVLRWIAGVSKEPSSYAIQYAGSLWMLNAQKKRIATNSRIWLLATAYAIALCPALQSFGVLATSGSFRDRIDWPSRHGWVVLYEYASSGLPETPSEGLTKS